MTEKKEKFPSTFTVDNFSSTTTLANHEIKVPIGSKETLNEKAYDPYEHRQIEHPNTFFGALIHIIKSSLGTGILAIPSAFMYAGLVTGFVGTILIGILCTHTIHMLVAASQEVCARLKIPHLGFSETAEAVFRTGPPAIRKWSNFAKWFVEIALLLTYYIGGAVYVVFISHSLQQIVAHYHEDLSEYGDSWYMLAIMLPLVVCCQIRELKYLVPFSFIANTCMTIAFSITLYYIFVEVENIDISNRSLFGSLEGIPRFFSTVVFAMEGIGTVMPIENSMSEQKFIGCPGVLNTAMAINTALFTSIGFFGYLAFGDKTQASITFNLCNPDCDNPLPAQIAKATISAAVFFTFMLQFYVPVEITWNRVKPYIIPRWHNMAQIMLRTGLVLFIIGIAAAVPDLSIIIDLVGSIFFSTLGLFIPAVVDTVVRWDNRLGTFKWILIKNGLIVFVSIFALCSGSFYAIQDMIKKFSSE